MSTFCEKACTEMLKQFILAKPGVSDDNKTDIWSEPAAAVNSAVAVATDCDIN